MWFPLRCSFSQLCWYWKSLFRGCFLRWSSWGPGREGPWLCWRHKPVPSGLSRSFLSLWLWQLWKIRVEGVLSQSCWWEVMATKIGPLTLESPHILLNLTLLLQQEKLTPSAHNFTDVPSCEGTEEKGRANSGVSFKCHRKQSRTSDCRKLRQPTAALGLNN